MTRDKQSFQSAALLVLSLLFLPFYPPVLYASEDTTNPVLMKSNEAMLNAKRVRAQTTIYESTEALQFKMEIIEDTDYENHINHRILRSSDYEYHKDWINSHAAIFSGDEQKKWREMLDAGAQPFNSETYFAGKMQYNRTSAGKWTKKESSIDFMGSSIKVEPYLPYDTSGGDIMFLPLGQLRLSESNIKNMSEETLDGQPCYVLSIDASRKFQIRNSEDLQDKNTYKLFISKINFLRLSIKGEREGLDSQGLIERSEYNIAYTYPSEHIELPAEVATATAEESSPIIAR